DTLAFGLQLDSRQLIGIKRKQPLVAEILGCLIEAGFHAAVHTKDSGVILQLNEGPTAGRRVVTDQQVFRLSVFFGDDNLQRWRGKSVGRQVRRLVFDQAVRGQRGELRYNRTD